MALLPIITAPDPLLKRLSAPVAAVDDDIRKLMDDLLETMYDAPGIGLSAIQVGVPKCVLVVDVAADDSPPAPLRMANPEIIWSADEFGLHEEGCLSLPEQYAEVERPVAIEVTFLDYDGKPQRLKAESLLATCLQHEIDHLDGLLFVDHISMVKRQMILRKLQKMKLQKATA